MKNGNPPIKARERDLLTLLNSTSLFFETSATVIDGSEKLNRQLNLELQSSHVSERCSKFYR